jgi:hypothetical protein
MAAIRQQLRFALLSAIMTAQASVLVRTGFSVARGGVEPPTFRFSAC